MWKYNHSLFVFDCEMGKRKNQDESDDAYLAKMREKKLLSIEATAELYLIGRSKLNELTNAEDCPFVLRIGGHRKIKKEASEECIMRKYSVWISLVTKTTGTVLIMI